MWTASEAFNGAAAGREPSMRHSGFAGLGDEPAGEQRHGWISDAPLLEIEAASAEEGYLRLQERRPLELVAGKRVLIFGVPGAFAERPTARLRHYGRLAAQLGGRTIDEVWCVAIHKPLILGLWSVDLLPRPYFRLLCDATGRWTGESGLAEARTHPDGHTAAFEYSLLTRNGAVQRLTRREV